MNDYPMMQFDSHVAGKNATVRLWPDRIEWVQDGWMGPGTKVAMGAMTMGASLLATGARGKRDENIIPIRTISSVTSRKSGLTKNEGVVSSGAGTIALRCSEREAAQFKALLLRQMANGGMPPQQQIPPQRPVQQMPPRQAPQQPPQPPRADPMQQLQQLAKLRDAGILTEEESQAKKTDILGRM